MLEEFKPIFIARGGMAQTIFTHYVPSGSLPQTQQRHTVTLEDGDQIIVSESRPPEWQHKERIVVLIHGLAGCEDSSYIVRIGRKLYEAGYLVMRMNLRSSGPGIGLAKKPYHSGRSEDCLSVLRYITKNFPDSPITQCGFSLSANITLKMAGELRADPQSNLDSCIAVSPPVDLYKSSQKIIANAGWLFNHYFISKLKKTVRSIEKHFPDMEKLEFFPGMNLMDFDDRYTSVRSGFKDARDYYEQCSCRHFIPDIKIPTLIIHSTDDPVVDSECIQEVKIPSAVTNLETEYGGHVGFLASNGFWLDRAILKYLEKCNG